jgi:NADH dehydrogenase (ubiquinone) Fe-S protein 6
VIERGRRRCYLAAMPALPPPEVIRVSTLQVACDGSGEISPALGHPRVYLRIDEEIGFVECGYCDRRFVLDGGPADTRAA